MSAAITFADIVDASDRLRGHIRTTPLRLFPELGLHLKMEHVQGTGSFKLRGATNVVRGLRPSGVVTGSSGNHGAALTHAALNGGVERAVVVMAEGHSPQKRARLETMGAEVVFAQGGNSARDELAQDMAADDGLMYVSSHSNPWVIAGQGTVGLEVLDALPDIEAVVVPVGGGGLVSGIATAVRHLAPDVKVIGVEPVGADDTKRSLEAGHRIEIDPPSTICDGVRAQTPGDITFPIVQALVDDVVVVSDDQVAEAMYLLWREGLIIEPSGALSVAGARHAGLGSETVCVLSGGNVTFETHSGIIQPWLGEKQ
ncbi:MAG: pyridoxal-phosphate dependent enzyme [Actinomycetota bacterium]|nr:pyridoxal-phosphate dependent enzyme [Actinomycetota bacterium]